MTEKRYYWIKLKDSFLTSDAVDFLMSQKYGANYVVLYQMLCLKTINTGGELSRQIGEVIIPFDIDKIQRDCKYFEKDTVVVALELYRKLGLVYENKDGILQIADFENLVGGEVSSAKRVREYRLKKEQQKALQCNGECNTNVTQEIRDKRIEIRDKNIEKKESKPQAVTFDFIISSYTQNKELHTTIIEFIKMRKLNKSTMTDNALKLLLNKLNSLGKNDAERIAMLENSIVACWKTVYPLKTDKPKEEKKSQYTKEQIDKVLGDFETWEL